jgi:DNA-binding PadR family transcriptional regulator
MAGTGRDDAAATGRCTRDRSNQSLAVYLCRRYIGAMTTPLREPTFLILTALARGPLHGYGLITEVAELSDGRITLRPGTLYGALDRLSDDGMVAPDHEEVVDGRLRRYYRLTDEGLNVLGAETERMRRNLEAATVRLKASGWAPAGGLA